MTNMKKIQSPIIYILQATIMFNAMPSNSSLNIYSVSSHSELLIRSLTKACARIVEKNAVLNVDHIPSLRDLNTIQHEIQKVTYTCLNEIEEDECISQSEMAEIIKHLTLLTSSLKNTQSMLSTTSQDTLNYILHSGSNTYIKILLEKISGYKYIPSENNQLMQAAKTTVSSINQTIYDDIIRYVKLLNLNYSLLLTLRNSIDNKIQNDLSCSISLDAIYNYLNQITSAIDSVDSAALNSILNKESIIKIIPNLQLLLKILANSNRKNMHYERIKNTLDYLTSSKKIFIKDVASKLSGQLSYFESYNKHKEQLEEITTRQIEQKNNNPFTVERINIQSNNFSQQHSRKEIDRRNSTDSNPTVIYANNVSKSISTTSKANSDDWLAIAQRMEDKPLKANPIINPFASRSVTPTLNRRNSTQLFENKSLSVEKPTLINPFSSTLSSKATQKNSQKEHLTNSPSSQDQQKSLFEIFVNHSDSNSENITANKMNQSRGKNLNSFNSSFNFFMENSTNTNSLTIAANSTTTRPGFMGINKNSLPHTKVNDFNKNNITNANLLNKRLSLSFNP